jgi:hypothetical protein
MLYDKDRSKFQEFADKESSKLDHLMKIMDIKNYAHMNLYSPFDLICEYKDSAVLIEAKVRNCKSDQYNDSVLEFGKYDMLIKCAEMLKVDRIWYAMFFTDSICLCWNLLKVVPTNWCVQRFVKQTAAFDKEWKEKKVTFLDNELATKIKI